MTSATISAEGQVAIPEEIRQRLNLGPGTQVSLDVEGDKIVIARLGARRPHWSSMRGMVSTGPSLTKALEQEHLEELAREDGRSLH